MILLHRKKIILIVYFREDSAIKKRNKNCHNTAVYQQPKVTSKRCEIRCFISD